MLDITLSHGKKKGGHIAIAYEQQFDQQNETKIEIEYGLRHALIRNELTVFYQPKLNLENGEISGAEALVRWNGLDGKNYSPAEFIPVAEETGLIASIGHWVLKQSCIDAVNWNRELHRSISVAVNISAKQLLHSDLPLQVKQILEETKLAPELLELEITESVALSDFNLAIEKLEVLKKLGIKLTLDDFGAGFSSLSYLNKLPVNVLKTDQSFIQNLSDDKTIKAITHSVINLAHDIGLSVIAEDPEHLAQLRSWHCEQVQGYLVARPMPYEQFVQFKSCCRTMAQQEDLIPLFYTQDP